MLTKTTLNLPNSLVNRARSYAAEHHTTLTALVIEQLESIIKFNNQDLADEPLLMFSRGLLTKEQTINAIGVRDYAELLVMMGDMDIPLPLLPPDEIDRQVNDFVNIWSHS